MCMYEKVATLSRKKDIEVAFKTNTTLEKFIKNNNGKIEKSKNRGFIS